MLTVMGNLVLNAVTVALLYSVAVKVFAADCDFQLHTICI